MRHLVRIVSLVALMLTMLSGAVFSAVAVAHEATPQAGADQFPLTPDPAMCTVEPRPTEELVALWFPTEGSPVADAAEAAAVEEPLTEVTLPVGEPVTDEAVVSEITATVVRVLSCFSAGDFPRATALFTDDLVRMFGPGPGETQEDVIAFLEAPPVAEANSSVEILAVTDVMLLDDGRVGAFVVDRDQEAATVYVVFEQVGDRWLVDEVFEFTMGEE